MKYITKRYSRTPREKIKLVGKVAVILTAASMILNFLLDKIAKMKKSSVKVVPDYVFDPPMNSSSCRTVDDLRSRYTFVPDNIWDLYLTLVDISDHWVQYDQRMTDFRVVSEGSIDYQLSKNQEYFTLCYFGLCSDGSPAFYIIYNIKQDKILIYTDIVNESYEFAESELKDLLLKYLDTVSEEFRDDPRIQSKVNINKKIVSRSRLGSRRRMYSASSDNNRYKNISTNTRRYRSVDDAVSDINNYHRRLNDDFELDPESVSIDRVGRLTYYDKIRTKDDKPREKDLVRIKLDDDLRRKGRL